MSALLAFAAALLTLRLSGDLVRRYRRRRAPELAAWAAGLGAYSVAAGALAWGAAAGWSDAAFRVYYLGGALLTFRSRPVGNALILAGIAIAGIGSGLAGVGIGALAPAIAVAAVLLYAGFVAPSTLTKPRPPEHAQDA